MQNYLFLRAAPLVRLVALTALLAAIVIASQSSLLHAQDPPLNNEATGTPVTMGTPRVGEVLWIDFSSIADDDGLENATFQLQIIADDDFNEPRAYLRALSFASNYRVASFDAGMRVGFGLSFEDDAGNDEIFDYVWTSTVTAITPAPPENLSASVGNSGDVNLSWTAPTEDLAGFNSGVGDGGSDITGYKVQWKLASGSWEASGDVTEASVTGTTYAVTGLNASNTYTV